MDIQAVFSGTSATSRTDGRQASGREGSGSAFASLLQTSVRATADRPVSAEASRDGQAVARGVGMASEDAAADAAALNPDGAVDDGDPGVAEIATASSPTSPVDAVMDALEKVFTALGIDIVGEVAAIIEDGGGLDEAVRHLVTRLTGALNGEGDTLPDDINPDDMALLADSAQADVSAALASMIDARMTGSDRVETLSSRMSAWAQEMNGLGGGLSGLAGLFGRAATSGSEAGHRETRAQQPVVAEAASDAENSDDGEGLTVSARNAADDRDGRARDAVTTTDTRGRQFSDALFRLGADLVQNNSETQLDIRAALAGRADASSLTPISSAVGQSAAAAGGAAAGLAAEAAAQRPGSQPSPVQDQIALHLKKLANSGNDRIRLQLQPVRLGAVDIVMEISRDGRVQAVIMADKAETLHLLQRDSRALEQALQEANLTVDQNSLRFDLADRQPGARDGDQNTPFASRGDRLWAEGDDSGDGGAVLSNQRASLRALDITI